MRDNFFKCIYLELRDGFMDVRELITSIPRMKEPYLLVLQIHDTHLPFKSMGIRDTWYDWFKEVHDNAPPEHIEKLVSLGLSPSRYMRYFTRLTISGDLKISASQQRILKRARAMQIKVLIYVMWCLSKYIDKNDTIFHLVGDHICALGEHGHFGNTVMLNDKVSPGATHTVWLTNQRIGKANKIHIYDMERLITKLLPVVK